MTKTVDRNFETWMRYAFLFFELGTDPSPISEFCHNLQRIIDSVGLNAVS